MSQASMKQYYANLFFWKGLLSIPSAKAAPLSFLPQFFLCWLFGKAAAFIQSGL